MARAQMQLMNDEFRRTKAWISEKREATALQRNSVWSRKYNKAVKERDKAVEERENLADQLDEKDAEVKDRQELVDYLQGRMSRWGRPKKNDPRYRRPEDPLLF